MNFYIGQRIVCVESCKSHNGPGVSKGSVYTVYAVCACNCRTRLDVGMAYTLNAVTRCGWGCGWKANNDDRRVWFGSQNFRPLDTLDETMERIEKEGCPLELEHA